MRDIPIKFAWKRAAWDVSGELFGATIDQDSVREEDLYYNVTVDRYALTGRDFPYQAGQNNIKV